MLYLGILGSFMKADGLQGRIPQPPEGAHELAGAVLLELPIVAKADMARFASW